MLLTYWNTVAFQVLYAHLPTGRPGDRGPDAGRPAGARPVGALRGAPAGRASVTEALERFDTQRAGTLLAAYVDDLSNWYVRRSRRRFWDGDPAALATLHECLYVVTLLMAPMTPFITERVWQDMFARDLRRAARVGAPADLAAGRRQPGRRRPRAAGAARPPAGRARPGRPRRGQGADPAAAAPRAGRHRRRTTRLSEELRAEVAEELNVGGLEPLSAAGADLVDHSAKGNFRALGKRFAKETPQVAAAIAAADAGALRRRAAADGRADASRSTASRSRCSPTR